MAKNRPVPYIQQALSAWNKKDRWIHAKDGTQELNLPLLSGRLIQVTSCADVRSCYVIKLCCADEERNSFKATDSVMSCEITYSNSDQEGAEALARFMENHKENSLPI